MTDPTHSLPYPRKHLARFFVRAAGRLLLPVLFRVEIHGMENFPRTGPLLVVGNHTAAMEAVLLNIYAPRQIEMLSAADTPAERITEMVADLYGVIPLHRGSYDRAALSSALDVLRQKGFIGLFPEGGIWEEGRKKALPGIAWLSYRSGAPVLPVGFNDTTGALNAGLNFKRPTLKMRVGQVLEPARLPDDMPRKQYLQSYANQVMQAVHDLVPPEDYQTEPEITGESFQLEITLTSPEGHERQIPPELQIKDPQALAKFLHRPAILKIFAINLELPVQALQELDTLPELDALQEGCHSVLEYLEHENPYLLTYRFGVKGGLAMKSALEELSQLLEWCRQQECQIHIKPIRSYFSLKENRQVTQIIQGQFQSWM